MKSAMKNFTTALILVVITGVFVASRANVQAAIFEPGFEVETITGGLNLPTAMAFSPDGRIFIAEKSGTVRVVKNGVLLAEPVITLTDINTFGDRGLIGMATDPNFLTNGYLYLSYTYENTPGSNFSGPKTGRIVRVTVVGDVASEASKIVLVGTIGGSPTTPSCEDFAVTDDCIPSDSPSHSVGGLRFGPDGKLYATLGEGANFDYPDPKSLRAQNIDSLAGKLLRINSDGTAPTDNPFYDGDPNANRSKVYALGLRNAFRFNFQPITGALFLGDVGWSSWEEINLVTPAANFGWPCREGNDNTTHNCTASSPVTDPLYAYGHDAAGAGSVTAGASPANDAYPAQYNSSLFIGDYAQNWIKRLVLDENNAVVSVENFMDNPNGPVDISTGPDGTIYYISIYTGELNRLTHTTGNRHPVPVISANPTSGLTPLSVAFFSDGSIDPDGDPLTYAWNFGDGGVSSLPNPEYTYIADGMYNVVLALTDDKGSSASKSITITAGNQAPQASITSPASGSLYVPFQVIQLNGTGNDLEDGILPDSAFHWDIILHHNTHIHYMQEFNGTKNPSFEAPDHAAEDIYTEIALTVTDSVGLVGTQSINIYLNTGATTGNLIQNPSVETEASAIPLRPTGWERGGWGTNTRVFSYPVAGFDGDKALKIEVTSYTDGDAKWFFFPVNVTPLESYVYSDYYTANVGTDIVAQFGFPDGSNQYQYIAYVPPAASPTKVEKTIVVPSGTQTLTVFHSIQGVGTLTTDNFSLTIQTAATPENLITNGSFEIENGANPLGWTPIAVAGTAATFNYPTIGVDGGKAVHIEITNIGPDGNARWQFDEVSVTTGTEYTYEEYYKASTIHDIIGRYTFADGSEHFFGLKKEIPAASDWTFLTGKFVAPENITSVTLMSLISTNATLDLDNTKMFASGTGTPPELIPPVVAFTNPLDGNTVSGIITLTATATDNVGVAGWFFAADGSPLQIEQSGTPVTFNWDSASVPNGTHTLKITARDAVGNNSREIITVTVDNTSPPSSNLILNPSLETAGTTGDPENWFRGGWGTNNRIFTYPVAGTDGASAAKVEITSYTNGDAKWYFQDVPVTGGNMYIFTHQYNTTVPTDVFARYTVTGGGFQYQFIETLPITSGWTAASRDITVPANATSMTIFHLIRSVGSLSIDAYNLNSNTTSDTTAPTVSVTSPASGSTLSGVTTVTATAADNVGVAGVTLFIDGTSVLTEDTTTPYEFSWDTSTVTNGAHTISARARDAAGNTADATPVSVTVANTPPPTVTNLILNPSLETAGTTGDPENWFRGGWGTNNRIFTYPVAGTDGASAAKVEITSYTNGDAKWYFQDVPVTAGSTYTLSNAYRSNIATQELIRYTMAGGAVQYSFLATLPSTAGTWQNFQQTITVPANVVSMTVFHLIGSVGYLEVDTYSLTTSNGTILDAFTRGMVSYTFDDGWFSHYTQALPILNAVNAKGTFYIVSDETLNGATVEQIQNPSLETVGATGDPENWFRGGWGTNNRIFTYPVAGTDGASAAKVEITSYTNGDAKWYFQDVAVLPSRQYVISDSYNSTSPSQTFLRYTLSDSTVQYVSLGVLPSTAGAWQNFQQTITVPANAASVTLFHVLATAGSLTVDNYSLKLMQTVVSVPQMLEMQTAGHEIGAHTKTHVDLTTLTPTEQQDQIAGSRAALLSAGVSSIDTFAYPFGAYSADIQTMTANAGHLAARSIDRGWNVKTTDTYALKIQAVMRSTTVAEIEGWVTQAANDKTWLILMFHQIDQIPENNFGTTPAILQQTVNYIQTANVDVVTVRQGAALMNP